MKKIILAYCFYFLSGLAAGQAGQDLKRQVEDLNAKVKTLENACRSIRAERRSADSLTYYVYRLEIFEAFSNVSKLGFDFRNTTDKIAITGLFTRLMQANNPTSDILGFRFTDLVFAAADKHFKKELGSEADKKRFSQVVSKIIGSPVVSSLANSNPFTSVVSSIITTAIGFTSSQVNLDKEGGRIRNIAVEQYDPFDQDCISAFRTDLQVYIAFYDELIIASQKYLTGLDNLNDKYSYLMQSVQRYKDELFSGLECKEANPLISLTLSLPEPDRAEIDYNQLINDAGIRRILSAARKYPMLKQSVSDFKKEYNLLLFNFLNSYKLTLEKAMKFPDQVIDKQGTEQLVRDIETFVLNQKRTEQEEPDIFN